jgi:hypothetical protein
VKRTRPWWRSWQRAQVVVAPPDLDELYQRHDRDTMETAA